MKAITKIFDGKAQRLEAVAVEKDRRIRNVQVLNNTPYFLYVGREQNVTRENALFVVEPYTDVRMPVSESQALYALEGPAIGIVPNNCQATILWGIETCDMAARKTGRNVVIPLYQAAATAAVSTGLTAQSVGSAPGVSGAESAGPAPFAVPASAARRTIYGNMTAGTAKFSAVSLEGSTDGVAWFKLADLVNSATTSFQYDIPSTRALPPYLRINMSQDAYNGSTAQVNMVVDL